MKDITLLDGATGTRLLDFADEAGVERVSAWIYNIEHPEFVTREAREYVEAGSRIILTNTFSANGPEVESRSGYTAPQVVAAAVAAARSAVAGTDARVALDIGPLSETLEPFGDMGAEAAAGYFGEMLRAGADAGAELVFFETFMDLRMMLVAAREAAKYPLPIFCCMTFSAAGRTLFGDSVADFVSAVAPLGVAALGLNCSLGPDLAAPIMREFAARTALPLIFKPNAGMPILCGDGSTRYECSAEDFLRQSEAAFPYIQYIGGCCGTDASHIRALSRRL